MRIRTWSMHPVFALSGLSCPDAALLLGHNIGLLIDRCLYMYIYIYTYTYKEFIHIYSHHLTLDTVMSVSGLLRADAALLLQGNIALLLQGNIALLLQDNIALIL